ncbi:cyclase family protein [Nocardioides marmotae]|uniref:cyclase family protein n=1 Tax=Nocardioides marmotae TaxID=2663857 RepID=UPI0012B6191D|nr:cyclase family protein [Nocardioides marmotae]MBC9732340.1 cyclase family protein [Nocardioides marmotae]MTB83460.1 cyclase family protein [Nocardioides marmotae]
METYRELGKRLSNWGRWGEEDEIGTINLITPEIRVAAAALIQRGVTFDLGIPFSQDGPQPGGNRVNPLHLMRETGENQDFPGGFHFADDYVVMPLQCATQWDGLSHVFYDDHLYNGYPSTNVDSHGAAKNAIDALSKDVAGRGVLLDIAGVKGVENLEAGYVVTPEDLDEACAAHGVVVRSGDILCIRTGWRTVFTRAGDAAAFMAGEPGLGLASVEWLRERDVAAVASDNWAIEALPGETDDALPVHCVLIRDLGMTLGEMFDFEELAADCREDGRYEFFLAAPPLKFARAVGSPINPLAIK